MSPLRSVVASLFQVGPPEARWAGYGITVAAGAVWHSLSGFLAGLLVVLFMADLALGTLKAVHVGGLGAFCRDKFWRAFLKLGAAVVGIALFTIGDLLLHRAGLDPGLTPLTSAALFGICWGFFWSATQNLGHFFPDAQTWVDAALRKVRNPEETPRRRASDRVGGS